MTNSPITSVTRTGVLVADGYGVNLCVRRGRLIIEDGMGTARRRRELSRIARDIRRIVILADTGTVSLDAIRWCADVGEITIMQIDRDGRALLHAGRPGRDDARLRRAQAAAAGSEVGLSIARGLLDAKLTGQAAVLREAFEADTVAKIIDGQRSVIADGDLVTARDAEAAAANAYFGAWSRHVVCRFAARDAGRVPEHWRGFGSRTTPILRGRTSRSAVNPVNALLNYGYALAEAECRLALVAVGLDPGMGIVHTDKRDRDSLALDLLEAIRPLVDQHVLALLAARHFRTSDFYETRDGVCRILEPLTHELCERLPEYAAAAAPLAEGIAHALARSSPGNIDLRTPLTRANHTRAQTRGARSATRKAPSSAEPMPTCRQCGEKLWERGRQLCSACWSVTRTELAAQRARRGVAAIAHARAAGNDPTQTAAAREKRQQSLLSMKASEAAWTAAGSPIGITEQQMRDRVVPALATLSIKDLQLATGLSASACSMIRSGKRSPHPRHWDALAACVAVGGHRN